MRLIIRNIHKKYDNINVIDDASYTFESGRVYGITGKKGAGKTALLRCISGECRPDRGTVRIDTGVKNIHPAFSDFTLLQRDFILPEYMTVGEYVEYGALLHGIGNTDRIANAMNLMDIKDKDNILIKDLTDKDKLKTRLAATLLFMPSVVMLDDIFEYDADDCTNLIKDAETGHIFILTAERRETIESVCDETLTLYGGRLSYDSGFGGSYA